MRKIKNFFFQKPTPISNRLKDSPAKAEKEVTWSELSDDQLVQEPAQSRFDPESLGFISTDLTEATYSTPHEVLDWNCEFLDDVLSDFPVWQVYHNLFKLHPRKVDQKELVRKEYTDVPSYTTKRGGFMGDPLSFVHLTLQMSASVNTAVARAGTTARDKTDRPLGQSAGDDLAMIGASNQLYAELRTVFEATHMTVSKIDSWSADSMTFCEQYAVKPTDEESYSDYRHQSKFGDLFYLDIIKGSILSGKSKVKSVGAIPLIGHSRMLNAHVRYHPIEWVKQRAPKLLWAANYRHAHKLQSSLASLPPSLGGINMAIGTVLEFENDNFQKRLPYYEAISEMNREDFLKYQLLLSGIYAANPKGKAWENDPRLFEELLPKLEIFTEDEAAEALTVPVHIARKGFRAVSRYLRDEEGLITFRSLLSELIRKDAFIKCWREVSQNSFMTLPLRAPKERASKVWKHIYETVQPVENVSSQSIEEIAMKFDNRTWGLHVKKDDPAIVELYDGMPSLAISYRQD